MVGLARESEQPPMGEEVWAATRLLFPSDLAGRSYRNLFTGEVLTADSSQGMSGPLLGTVLGQFRVALLESR
jgi:hypothetical protein